MAQDNLGLMYEQGQGVTQSDARAVEWYKRSVAQGHASAQAHLGFMYEQGRGVTQSDARAV